MSIENKIACFKVKLNWTREKFQMSTFEKLSGLLDLFHPPPPPHTFSYLLQSLPTTPSFTLLPPSLFLFLLGLVWFGMGGGHQMTSEFICEKLPPPKHPPDSSYILPKDFRWHSRLYGGDIAIIATSSRSRSLRDLRL